MTDAEIFLTTGVWCMLYIFALLMDGLMNGNNKYEWWCDVAYM